MIPISDDNSDRHLTPVVNYIFIALNILVFVFLQGMGTNLHFTYSFAAVPAEILSGSDITTHGQIVVDQYTGEQFEIPGLQVTPIPVYFTLSPENPALIQEFRMGPLSPIPKNQ